MDHNHINLLIEGRLERWVLSKDLGLHIFYKHFSLAIFFPHQKAWIKKKKKIKAMA